MHTGCHLGSRRGAGRAPETRLGLGQPLAWAGSQSGGWGLASRAARLLRPGAWMEHGLQQAGGRGSTTSAGQSSWHREVSLGPRRGPLNQGRWGLRSGSRSVQG